MSHPPTTPRRRARCAPFVIVIALVAALSLAACGSSSGGGSRSSVGPAHSSVDVLYAASLENVMDKRIAPAFHAATGDTLDGYPAGSSDLASEIKGKVRRGDVFISASPSADTALRGAHNGDWVSWYAPFASTTLVLGYNPHGRFASTLQHTPWYRVVDRRGFRLGFTDPALDPKGVLAVAALRRAARLEHEPALSRVASDKSDLFPEQDLAGRLQSGQLDAGFFYTVEAAAAHIPTVALTPVHESAPYTITILHGAVHAQGAEAFVRFLLGTRGRALLRRAGLTLRSSPPARGSGVPHSLAQVIHTAR